MVFATFKNQAYSVARLSPILLLYFILIGTSFSFSNAQIPKIRWATCSTGELDDLKSIAPSKNGEVFVAATFKSKTISFDHITVIKGSNSTSSDANFLIVKYTADGKAQWAQTGRGVSTNISALSTDATGNLYAGGNSKNFVYGTIKMQDSGAFLMKLNTDGKVLWLKHIDTYSNAELKQLFTDKAGNTYVSGIFADSVLLGKFNLTSKGGSDIFVAKYDSSGAAVWAYSAGSVTADTCSSIISSGDGNIILSVKSTNSKNNAFCFKKDSVWCKYQSTNHILKISKEGDLLWHSSLQNASNALLLAKSDGSTFYSCALKDTLITGADTLIENKANGADFVLGRFTAEGLAQGVYMFGGAGSEKVSALAKDSSNNIFLLGTTNGAFLFGNQTVKSDIQGTENLFMLKIAANGTAEGGKCFKANLAKGNDCLQINLNNTFYLASALQNALDFDGQELNSDQAKKLVLVTLQQQSDQIDALEEKKPNKLHIYYDRNFKLLKGTFAPEIQAGVLILYNMQGHVVLKHQYSNAGFSIYLNDLCPGLYLYQLTTKASLSQGKIIID